MVEMAVIETASENSSAPLSTSVVYYLDFPMRTANKQAVNTGRPLIDDGVQVSPPFTFTADRRLNPGTR